MNEYVRPSQATKPSRRLIFISTPQTGKAFGTMLLEDRPEGSFR